MKLLQLLNHYTVCKWVRVGFNVPSTHCRSFWRRVFPVNHLHWYWQPNKNNQEAEHTDNTTQKVAIVKAQQTRSKKTQAKQDDRQRAWFSRLLKHPAQPGNRTGLLFHPQSPHGTYTVCTSSTKTEQFSHTVWHSSWLIEIPCCLWWVSLPSFVLRTKWHKLMHWQRWLQAKKRTQRIQNKARSEEHQLHCYMW